MNHKKAKPEAKTIGVENSPIYKLDTIIKELNLQNVYIDKFILKENFEFYAISETNWQDLKTIEKNLLLTLLIFKMLILYSFQQGTK